MGSSPSRAVPQYQESEIDEEPVDNTPGRYYESLPLPDITAARAGIGVSDLRASLERRKGKLRRQGGRWQATPMTDVEYAYELQMERVSQWLATGNDAQLAKSVAGARETNESYLRTMAITEAEREVQHIPEMLGHDKPLPPMPPKRRRVRFADPAFALSPPERSGRGIVYPPLTECYTSIEPRDEVYHRAAEPSAETERGVWSEWIWVPIGPVDGDQFKSLPVASSPGGRPSINNQATASSSSDDVFLKAMLIAEEAAREDRRMAQMLQRGEPLPSPKPCQLKLMDPAFVLCAPERKQVPTLRQRNTNKPPRKDRPASGTAQPTIEPRVECVICCRAVKTRKTIQAPCEHRFCRRCITAFVEGCTKDESMYPLRCCLTAIPNEILAQLVAAPLLRLFETKEMEYQVPATTRLYCGEPTCAKFIGAIKPQKSFLKKTKDEMSCPTCLRPTCTKCKTVANYGHECPVDKAERTFKELAKRQAWPTCPSCFSTVEKTEGCNHMVCRCKMEFCYKCTKPWKNHKVCR